ncbi:hypothetical protein Syun_005996 [Stephania yunnanensis]|uniref:Uncharacterized protein n=1 Tax=Stephania yunnanensis TaxID=152371 RepID=A0AAP0PY60_9MAGN
MGRKRCKVVRPIWEWCRKFIPSKHKDENIDGIEEYLHPIDESDAQGLEEWILRKGVRDMKQWMELNRSNELNHFIEQLFPNAPCASPNLLINQLKNSTDSDSNKTYEVSSLSVVLLARIATVCSHSAPSLTAVLSEIFEVIHFVENCISSTSFQNKKKSKFAKAAYQGPSSRDELLKVFKISDAEAAQLNVLGKLRAALPSDDPVKEELCIITDFIITHQNCRSIQELDNFIPQLFVEMLNECLAQLPIAIYKEITVSCPEDYEKAIRFSLKLLCKVESLKNFVLWSYPIETTIDKLITDSSKGES